MHKINGEYRVTLTNMLFDLPLKRYGKMTLSYDGEHLKGYMFPIFYWLESPFKGGSVDGDHFSFTVSFATPCQQYSMNVEGDYKENGKLTGVVHSPMGNYQLEGNKIV